MTALILSAELASSNQGTCGDSAETGRRHRRGKSRGRTCFLQHVHKGLAALTALVQGLFKHDCARDVLS